MLNGSNLPTCYWAKAVLTATMFSNLIPTPSRHNLSPYALRKGVPPRIKRLFIFGCRAIISIPKYHQGWKLGPTGSEGILLRTDSELVDEAQPEEAEVVDETHCEETASPCVNNSSTSLAEQSSYPIPDQALHCIKVIGP
ncbi:hypothetical protein O181_050769 [Austropuccinia psidii MF-1]|uniref:Retrovirus-related Pol polyprotein from transposon TNT 1-94 n=1 Tax=Austropuccinia psidii MF-1 TaxID=1389203 RepID=A0A9Q3DXD4_9BASI|nr:hypothetical protein [Austropuccinia psidii MF-1]